MILSSFPHILRQETQYHRGFCHRTCDHDDKNFYSNPEIDKLYIDSQNCRGEERDRILHRAEDIIMEEQAMIPLFGGETTYLLREGVSGLEMNPTGVTLVVTGLKKEVS